MKKYINADKNTLHLDIVVNFILDNYNIAATTITPLYVDDKLDDSAMADYQTFIMNVFEILTYYDFQYERGEKDPEDPRELKSKTSCYCWLAHKSELDNDNVPKWIRLRISDHIQDICPEHQAKLNTEYQKFLETHKHPATKLRQRYKFQNIVVNNSEFTTYEDALNAVEHIVVSWIKDRGIDISKYDPLEPW